MFTVHCLWNKIGDEVLKACSALGISKNHMRVVRMGKGVIVLEDTNRTKPCEEKELGVFLNAVNLETGELAHYLDTTAVKLIEAELCVR